MAAMNCIEREKLMDISIDRPAFARSSERLYAEASHDPLAHPEPVRETALESDAKMACATARETIDLSGKEENEQVKMEVSNLDLYYGDFHALKDVSLSFPKNQVTALIGPSGCGKSTLLKTLNRMNDLVEGCRIEGLVALDEENAYKDIAVTDLRRRVGMVFQQPNPFPMSIYDNIAFGPRTHGIKRRDELDEVVEQSLRDAALWDEVKDRLKKSALGLSGGQQQRLCIARALAVRPEVLLMNESTSALDPISTAKIEELVDTLKERYTVVMVTHNMLQALRVSDKTAFFLLGEMVEAGDTQMIFTEPQDPRTADYVAGRFG